MPLSKRRDNWQFIRLPTRLDRLTKIPRETPALEISAPGWAKYVWDQVPMIPVIEYFSPAKFDYACTEQSSIVWPKRPTLVLEYCRGIFCCRWTGSSKEHVEISKSEKLVWNELGENGESYSNTGVDLCCDIPVGVVNSHFVRSNQNQSDTIVTAWSLCVSIAWRVLSQVAPFMAPGARGLISFYI